MNVELDTVVLTRDLPGYGSVAGDAGAIVHRHAEGNAYKIEFVAASGKSITVATLTSPDVRPRREQEILHVCDLAAAD